MTTTEVTTGVDVSSAAETGRQQPDEAARLLAENMIGTGVDGDTTAAFNAVVCAYGRAGKPDEALKWFGKMAAANVPYDDTSYGAVIQAFCKAGQPETATHWLSLLENEPNLSPTTARLGLHTTPVHLLAQQRSNTLSHS